MLGQQVASLFAKLGVDTSDAKRGLSQFDADLKKSSGGLVSFGSIGSVALLGVGASALKMATDAVGAATRFEQQMSAVKAVANATSAETAQLSATALKLGAAWGQSATDAGRAMEELTKGGLSVKDVMGGAAEATMTLAAAGGVDLATAASVAANAMNVFGMRASETAHVADMLAGAANATTADVKDFSMALQMAGAVSAQMNQSFDATTTALSLLAQAGIKNSDAGTSLKQMMLSLEPASKNAAAAMKDLGIITEDGSNRFFDAAGRTRSYAEIAGVLQTALAGLTDQQRIAALQTIFGSDAIRAATVMAKAGEEGYRKMYEEIGKTSALDAAKTRIDNLAGSQAKLNAEWERAQIIAANKYTPSIRGIVDAGTDLLKWLNDRSEREARTTGLILAGVEANHAYELAEKGVTAEMYRLTSIQASADAGARNLTEALKGATSWMYSADAGARNMAAGLDSATASMDALTRAAQLRAETMAKDPFIVSGQSAAYENDRLLRMVKVGEQATEVWKTEVRKQEQETKRAASAAVSGANRAADAYKDMARDMAYAFRDVEREVAGLDISLSEMAQESGDKWIEKWGDVDAAIRRTQQDASDALRDLDSSEALNASVNAQRRELEEKLSGQDRIFRQQMDDEEFHHREALTLARLAADENKALGKATTEREKQDIRNTFREKREELHQEHVDYDAEVKWRIGQENKLMAWRQDMEQQRDALARQLHEDEIKRKQEAIENEKERKIGAINAEWTEWQAKEADRLKKAQENARTEATNKLAAMKEQFFDKLAEAAAPGTEAFAGMMAAKIGEALSGIWGGGGGGDGSGAGGYQDPDHMPGGDTFEAWKAGNPEEYAAYAAEHGLASGGIVTRPTFRMFGESGPEAVIPLSRMGGLGGNVTIHLTVHSLASSPRAVMDEAARALKPALDNLVRL